MKKISTLIIILITVLITACSAEYTYYTDIGTTPIRMYDEKSLYGTYQYISFRMDCTDGTNLNNYDFYTFHCFFGYDGTYEYYNLDIESEGYTVDKSYKETVSSIDQETHYSYVSNYVLRLNQNNVNEGNGVYCDYEFTVRKLKDEVDFYYLRSAFPDGRNEDENKDADLPYFVKPLLFGITSLK